MADEYSGKGEKLLRSEREELLGQIEIFLQEEDYDLLPDLFNQIADISTALGEIDIAMDFKSRALQIRALMTSDDADIEPEIISSGVIEPSIPEADSLEPDVIDIPTPQIPQPPMVSPQIPQPPMVSPQIPQPPMVSPQIPQVPTPPTIASPYSPSPEKESLTDKLKKLKQITEGLLRKDQSATVSQQPSLSIVPPAVPSNPVQNPSPQIPPIAPPSQPTTLPPIAPPSQPTTFPPIAPPSQPTTLPPISPPSQPTTFPPIAPPSHPTTFPPIAPPSQPTTFPPIAPPSQPTTLPPIAPPTVPPSAPPIAPPMDSNEEFESAPHISSLISRRATEKGQPLQSGIVPTIVKSEEEVVMEILNEKVPHMPMAEKEEALQKILSYPAGPSREAWLKVFLIKNKQYAP